MCGESQDLTAGDAKPPGEQCGGRMEVEHVGESGFGPWESTSGSDTMLCWHGRMLVGQGLWGQEVPAGVTQGSSTLPAA